MHYRSLHGKMEKVLRKMEPDSIDSIVCDPPYGLGFMGKGWDHGVPGVEFWKEAYRVLKPGGYLLAFGGTRTFHRLAVAIEDAGFEIRDCLSWMYGSGFPKSMDVSKAIDKAAGAARPVVGEAMHRNPHAQAADWGNPGVDNWRDEKKGTQPMAVTIPATTEAAQWNGWGTALKPAWEPIIMARKPLGEKTVAGNVLKHGTGSININATRIGENPGYSYNSDRNGTTFHGEQGSRIKRTAEKAGSHTIESTSGRWPANVLLSHHEKCKKKKGCHPECAVRLLDEQTGIKKSGKPTKRKASGSNKSGNTSPAYHAESRPEGSDMVGYGDAGGASRFFYNAKATKRERNAGMPEGQVNDHPTLKPVAVMRWLVKMVTPPGGTVCDPFSGSGTTGVACVYERFNYIGIDKKKSYVKIAKLRIRHAIEERKAGRVSR